MGRVSSSQPCVYRSFPARIVLYRATLLVGSLVLGGVVSASVGRPGLAAYGVVALVALLWTMGHACRNCAYHGRRCDLGVSLVAARLFPRRGTPRAFPPQARAALKLLAAMLALPLALGVGALASGAPRASLPWLLIYAAALGAVIATTAISCPHCAMRNLCPLSLCRPGR